MVAASGRKRSQQGRRSQQGKKSQQGKRSQQGRRSQQGKRSQQGRRQKTLSRRSPTRQRKVRGQVKRQPVEKQRKRALKGAFGSINVKTLKQIKRLSQSFSHQAKGLMINFMEDICKQVSSEAERLRKESRDPLISPAHVQAALQYVVPRRKWRQMPAMALKNRR